jgi:hypothetical protein
VTLRSGDPFLLWFKLHRKSNTVGVSVSTASIVKSWDAAIKNVGKDYDPNINNDTYLSFDSLYTCAESRLYLKETKRPYTASCNPALFKPELKLVHANSDDIIGEHRSIWNETTKELFTYHWDTQKGVGKKYNLSYGLDRCTDKLKIRNAQNEIPGYDVYKQMFECCDRFNRNLHDKSWPYP